MHWVLSHSCFYFTDTWITWNPHRHRRRNVIVLQTNKLLIWMKGEARSNRHYPPPIPTRKGRNCLMKMCRTYIHPLIYCAFVSAHCRKHSSNIHIQWIDDMNIDCCDTASSSSVLQVYIHGTAFFQNEIKSSFKKRTFEKSLLNFSL